MAAIQRLRAIAALAVLLFHALPLIGLHFHFAAFGVDLFFVISGFLMISITGSDSRPLRFMIDRTLRIVPLYWLATGATLLLAFRRGAPWPSWSRLAESLLFVPFGEPNRGEYFFPILDVGWTLNFEMFFYLVFAATLFAPHRLRLGLLSLFFIGLVVVGMVRQPVTAPLALWTRPLILEFLAGAALGALWRTPPHTRPRLGWCLIGAALALVILVGPVAYQLGLRDPDYRVMVAAPATILLAGMLLLEERHDSTAHRRPLVALGDASYSLYLWHKPALTIAAIFAAKLNLPDWLTLIFALAAGVAAGLAAYWLLERPLLRWLRRPRTRHGWPVPGEV